MAKKKPVLTNYQRAIRIKKLIRILARQMTLAYKEGLTVAVETKTLHPALPDQIAGWKFNGKCTVTHELGAEIK